jgi:probable F420-dependent oxidoreductase
LKLSGVHVAISTGDAYGSIVESAVEAERLGFGGVWVPESVGRDAFVLLTDIACRTQRIQLGTGIVNHFSRSPAALAQAAMTLSEAADGRPVNLGLGASSRQVIERFHGMSYTKSAQRMRETIAIIRKAVAGESIDYHGSVFDIEGFRIPSETGPIRIFVAGLTPEMLAVVGEAADGWLPIWPSRRAMAKLLEPVDAAALKVGRPRPTVAAYIYTHLGPNLDQSRAPLRRSLAWYMTSAGSAYNALFRTYGYGDTVDAVEVAWGSGDHQAAAAVIPEKVIDDLCVLGEPATAPAQIELLRRQGVDVPVVRLPDGVGPSEGLQIWHELARAYSSLQEP